jgi:putative DNA primase/helicase
VNIDWPFADKRGRPSTKHKENTAALLEAHGILARYNLMRHRLEVVMPELESEPEYHENKSLAALSALAESNGLAEKQTFSHMTLLMKPYHPVWDWICSEVWDGRDRMPEFLGTLTASLDQDSALYAVLIEKWMNACVKAVMPRRKGEVFRPPGVLTLQGAQGMGKSRWIEALAPAGSGWVLSGAALDPHDKDSVTQLTSVWIVELSELDGTFDRAHIAAIKAFVDRPSDTYRRPYARTDEQVERRTMMAASVNPRAFLADETGSRRWWALSVDSINPDHGINMQQLWAQVRLRVEAGATWWLTAEEHMRLTVSNYQHTAADPLIEELWETYEVGGEHDKVPIKSIWSKLRDGRTITKVDSIKLGNAMEHVKWKGKVNGASVYRMRLREVGATSKVQESWVAPH